MLTPILGEIGGNIQVGLCGLGSAIGVGLVGMKASEAVGRNPGAFGKVIVLAVLGMALAGLKMRAFPREVGWRAKPAFVPKRGTLACEG